MNANHDCRQDLPVTKLNDHPLPDFYMIVECKRHAIGKKFGNRNRQEELSKERASGIRLFKNFHDDQVNSSGFINLKPCMNRKSSEFLVSRIALAEIAEAAMIASGNLI